MSTLQAISNGFVVDGLYVPDFISAVSRFAAQTGQDLAYRPFEAPQYEVTDVQMTYRWGNANP